MFYRTWAGFVADCRSRRRKLNVARSLMLSSDRSTQRLYFGTWAGAARAAKERADHAEEGVYRTLMEGIESFAGMMASTDTTEDANSQQPVAFDSNGRPYPSAMPARRR